MTGEIARKGDKARPGLGSAGPWSGPTAWHINFNRLQRCCERREEVIDAFSGLAGISRTVRRLTRESWTLCRRDGRPAKRP